MKESSIKPGQELLSKTCSGPTTDELLADEFSSSYRSGQAARGAAAVPNLVGKLLAASNISSNSSGQAAHGAAAVPNLVGELLAASANKVIVGSAELFAANYPNPPHSILEAGKYFEGAPHMQANSNAAGLSAGDSSSTCASSPVGRQDGNMCSRLGQTLESSSANSMTAGANLGSEASFVGNHPLIDDMSELEAHLHSAQAVYLENLARSIVDNEFKSQVQQRLDVDPDGSKFKDKHQAKFAQLAEIYRARLLRKEKAAAVAQAAHKIDDAVDDDWLTGTNCDIDHVDVAGSERSNGTTLNEWWQSTGENWKSPFFGHGYGAGVKHYLASKSSAQALASALAQAQLSGSAVRREKRALKSLVQEAKERRLKEGETKYLVFERFERSNGAVSGVVSENQYSIVDSGTTVTIKSDDGTTLIDLNPKSKIRIVGFNGSVSTSKGKGLLVGFAKAASGKTVELRIPEAHAVNGAPNDLLSVSAMVAQKYEFHFTAERSWIVTPEGESIDLVQKAGLYWLCWKRAVEAASQLDERFFDEEANFSQVLNGVE